MSSFAEKFKLEGKFTEALEPKFLEHVLVITPDVPDGQTAQQSFPCQAEQSSPPQRELFALTVARRVSGSVIQH